MFRGRFNLMKLTLKRRNELDKIVENFCTENNFDTSNDLFQELKKIGFDVYNAEFKRQLSGMILVNENVERLEKFENNKVIIYNKKYNYFEIRFILLHELAHYINKKLETNNDKILIAVRDHNAEYAHDVEEQEMDYMAASMLVPTKKLKEDIEIYIKEINCTEDNKYEILKNDEYFVQKLQQKYKAEKVLVLRRIEEVLEGV